MSIEARERNAELKKALENCLEVFRGQEILLHTAAAEQAVQSGEMAKAGLARLCEREQERKKQAEITKEIDTLAKQHTDLSAEAERLRRQHKRSSKQLGKQGKNSAGLAEEIATLEISKQDLSAAVVLLEQHALHANNPQEREDVLQRSQEEEREIARLKELYIRKNKARNALRETCDAQEKECAEMQKRECAVLYVLKKLDDLRKKQPQEEGTFAEQENENKEELDVLADKAFLANVIESSEAAIHVRNINAYWDPLVDEFGKKAPEFSKALRFYEGVCKEVQRLVEPLLLPDDKISKIQSYFLKIVKQAPELVTEEHIRSTIALYDYGKEKDATFTLKICHWVKEELYAFGTKIYREREKSVQTDSVAFALTNTISAAVFKKRDDDFSFALANTLYVISRILDRVEIFYKKHGQHIDPEEYKKYEYVCTQSAGRENIHSLLLVYTKRFAGIFIQEIHSQLPKSAAVHVKKAQGDLNAFFLLAVQHGLEWPVSRILSLGIYQEKRIALYQTMMLHKGRWKRKALPLLHCAVINKDLNMVQLFLDREFEVDYPDTAEHGWTSLHYLVSNTPFDTQSMEILQLLLERGASSDICAQDGETTPLSLARKKGLAKEVIALLESAVKAPVLPPVVSAAADAEEETAVMSPVQGIHFFGEGGANIAAASEHKFAL